MRVTIDRRTVMQYEWPLGSDMLATFSSSAFMQSMNTCAARSVRRLAHAAMHEVMEGVGQGGRGKRSICAERPAAGINSEPGRTCAAHSCGTQRASHHHGWM